jgi:hypothetical protein
LIGPKTGIESTYLGTANVSVGSKTEVAALRRDVCFAPVSGHRQACLGMSEKCR